MSKIEDLIRQFCPDGVEYVKLGNVCKTLQKGTLTTKELVEPDGNNYPVINSGRELYGYYPKFNNEGDAITVAARGEYAGYITYFSERFWAGGLCYPYRSSSSALSTKFIFYYLKSRQKYIRNTLVAEGSIPALNKGTLEQFEIPLPPLPVQEAIVNILDRFTVYAAELQAELQARQQQYNYYRDTLLSFEGREDVQWKKLGEVGKVCMCKRILKEQTSLSGDVPFFKIGTFGGKADAYISQELFETYKAKYSYPKKGDILISAAGTIGRTVVFDGCPSYFQDSNIVWLKHDESVVLNSYLKYCYSLNPWAVSTGGTIARLYNDNILNAIIPIPPLSEQQRIVDILDRFDTLVNDLSQGLPAEIEARQQQYEYYRDQLLTFKRKEA